jgi:hypothetical protein
VPLTRWRQATFLAALNEASDTLPGKRNPTSVPTRRKIDIHASPRFYPEEHAARGRRWVVCIGRTVMRPSYLEIASQSLMKICHFIPRPFLVTRPSADEWNDIVPYDRNQE